MSYAVLAMTDAEISDRAFVERPNRLPRRIAETLERGKTGGEFRTSLDAEMEATILLGLIHGLGTAVLVGQQTAETATAGMTFHLDRLTPGGGRAETGPPVPAREALRS